MTLEEFLAARDAEDEAIARAACHGNGLGGRWTRDETSYGGESGKITDANGGVIVYDEGSPSPAEADHIARWDPERVLAEVEARTRLLRDHSGQHVCEDGLTGVRWDEDARDVVERPCRVLRVLGEVWVDHPDYDPRWKVDADE